MKHIFWSYSNWHRTKFHSTCMVPITAGRPERCGFQAFTHDRRCRNRTTDPNISWVQHLDYPAMSSTHTLWVANFNIFRSILSWLTCPASWVWAWYGCSWDLAWLPAPHPSNPAERWWCSPCTPDCADWAGTPCHHGDHGHGLPSLYKTIKYIY